MYSQQGGRPGAAGPPKMANRYMKGRLPEGVDFAQYPGRSSTPLPTAESKSAERINQLKIWNEAATSDEKRRLNAAKGMASGVPHVGGRRTDSFKDAKDRHSASFHDSIAHPPSYHRTAMGRVGAPKQKHQDMFADRSDSESEDDQEETTDSALPGDSVHADATDHIAAQPLKSPDHLETAHQAPLRKPDVAPTIPLPAASNTRTTNYDPTTTKPRQTAANNSRSEPKESKACCNIM